ncbi:MAG: bifunctional precorrin-2 dehydrogenase/sirohydrochlorin ferrochelatase [Actinomycetota bacterium]|nr:bifunctional precorrin-2 dehydrogenase/sirohydrochlorin ferrochelatase [Actinomycetota bacterium]
MPVDSPQYPVNLILAGQRCLVVGGGRVAAGKVAGLLAAQAVVVVVAPEVVAGIADLEGVSVQRRRYRPGEVGDYRLAITATDDPAVNRQVRLDGEASGVWVNSADDPANCSFTLPAVVRQGPIMVTVATGGHSPALATWLRRHVERELDESYALLLDLLAERRAELQQAGIPTEGASWQEALDSGIIDLVRTGQIDRARERLQACL